MVPGLPMEYESLTVPKLFLSLKAVPNIELPYSLTVFRGPTSQLRSKQDHTCFPATFVVSANCLDRP
jgi:hypothetical protein